ncbi:hypothetical protein HNY73_019424 [Argiope bruennichi]|uniref:Uncharacterized protein n=1 Tax=Argiope bruennichi TaxID=94029 RepID=A0A8T0E3K3_ARGBR|nr:hypothetical protein HNY73_019424 [Argiope bruennichi]
MCRLVVDRNIGPEHHSAFTKSNNFLHKFRIIPSTRFSRDDSPPFIRPNTEVHEEHIIPLLPSPSEMFLCSPFADSTVFPYQGSTNHEYTNPHG